MDLLHFKKIIKRVLFGKAQASDTNPIAIIDENAILLKTKTADVISFDIFDTLITRKIYSPEDIFSIIGKHFKIKNFREARTQADSIARNRFNRDIDIDDIYKILKTDFHIKNTDKIKEYEEMLELELCIPRKTVLELFNTIKKQNKPLILVSDMYLKQTTIKKMLQKCGYKGFSKFYLSNSLNARKDTKTIWKIVQADFKNQKIIHLGDNALSDILYPNEIGIDTIPIASGKTLATNSPLNDHIKNPISDDDSLFWGTIINEYLFNSPFSTNYQINDLQVLGDLFYGPILQSFFNFLEKNTHKNDKLLFLSREGYYLQKLYKKYIEYNHLPLRKNFYFLASRKATISANFTSIKDIEKVATENYYSGSANNWFKQMLNIDANFKDFDITLPEDYEKIKPFIQQNTKKIITESKITKNNYLSYIKQTVKSLNSSTKIIDLGYSGTIQYELSKITRNDLSGLYLASSENIKQYSPKSNLLFLFNVKENPTYKKVYEYSLVLEFFLSAPYGQLIGFNKKGGKAIPIYNDETLTSKKANIIQAIKQGIEQHLKNTAKLKKILPSYNVSADAIFNFYIYCIEQNIISQNLKDMFDFTDNFTTDKTKNVFKIISKY